MRVLLYAVITTIVWVLLWVIPHSVYAQSTIVSRFEFAQILDEVTCSNCVVPDEKSKERYTSDRLYTIQSTDWYSLDDIVYDEPYYYCVASVTDKWIMQWFPRETSPFCAGKFCWESAITFSEVISAA